MKMFFEEKMGAIIVQPPVKFELHEKNLEEVFFRPEWGRQVKIELYRYKYSIEFPGECKKVSDKLIERPLALPKVITKYSCVNGKERYECYDEKNQDTATRYFWCDPL